ncbi:MAG: T9SS type A sorting domain-containing protein [candidate division WOR-3 bacterium]
MKKVIFFLLFFSIIFAQKDTVLFFDNFDRDTLGARWITYGTSNAYPWWGIDTANGYNNSYGSLADSPHRPWARNSYSYAAMSFGMNFADLLSANLYFYQMRNMQSGRGWGYAEVSTDGGQTWNSLGPPYQGQSGWEATVLSLNNYLNLPDVRIRFYILVADNANPNFDGWFIDSVRVIGTKRICRDVGPFRLVAPGDSIRPDTVITPQVQVVNYGNTEESLWVWLKIFYKGNLVYQESSWINKLERGGIAIANFPNWSPESLGVYNFLSWTALLGDTFYSNDTLRDSTYVVKYTHDVGTEEIISPRGTQYPRRFPLMAVYKNYGANTETFNAYFRIMSGSDTILKRSVTLQLLPDSSREYVFGDTTLRAGEYKVIAYTYLANDERLENNLKEESLHIIQFPYDVGVDRIISPRVTNNFDTITPNALVYNLGVNSATFTAHFTIFDTARQEFYRDSTLCTLPPDSVREITFARWMPTKIGRFFARCSLYCPEDENPENDTLTKYFTILVGGWLRRAELPLGPKKKGVSYGAALTYLPDTFVYALKGNGTCEFYRYNIFENYWEAACSIPYSGEKRKGVKNGGALCSNGKDRVFALKGNKTDEFWAYFPDGDTWHPLKPVPPIPKPGVKDGAGICYATKGDSEFVFLLKGTNSYAFFAYYIPLDTWLIRKDAPPGPLIKKWKKGSCIATDGEKIYALKGGSKYNEFYIYYILSDTWVTGCTLPLMRGGVQARKKKLKDGASLCYAPNVNRLYAFKGGNTDEFWSYSLSLEKWQERDPIPVTGKRVKSGGALTFTDFRIYAFKGNKTLEFWMYLPIETTGKYLAPLTFDYQASTGKGNSISSLLIYPNPNQGLINLFYTKEHEPLKISVYDALGRKVFPIIYKGKNQINLQMKGLSEGTYFLYIKEKNGQYLYKKVVYQR